MKRMCISLTVVFLLAGFTAAHAVNVSLGVNAWYLKWSPNFEDDFRGEGNAITANNPSIMSGAYNDRFEADPVFMAGPVLTLGFSEQWSMGLSVLVSQDYTIESSFNVLDTASPETFTQRYNVEFRRYDCDLTLNYRILSWFGIFAGLKYLRWDGTGSIDVNTSNTAYSYTSRTDIEVLGQALGPALGLSVSWPLWNDFFLTASASLLYMKSKEETQSTLTENAGPPVESSTKDDFYYHGYNGMLGIGYRMIAMRTTLLVGGRYQYLNTEDQPRDVFYGVTMTAMYTF